jgi:hypothetical protein
MMGHAMVEPTPEKIEEFAPTPDHEYQDSHYHDEEPDIVNDEVVRRDTKAAVKKKTNRRPPPKPHYFED